MKKQESRHETHNLTTYDRYSVSITGNWPLRGVGRERHKLKGAFLVVSTIDMNIEVKGFFLRGLDLLQEVFRSPESEDRSGNCF